MPEKDRQDDGEQGDIKPSQIPLLDDVVFDSSLALKPPRKKPKRENYSLDLNPDPPRVLDLFSGEPAPLADAEETSDAGKASPAPSAAERAESMMRAEATRMVDNLVQEYSQEIVRRLRDELTSLLDDLQSDIPRTDQDDDRA